MTGRRIDAPRPGLYRVRLTRGGPWVAARIIHAAARDPESGEVLDRSPLWSAEVNGKLLADPSPDHVAAKVDRVWIYGRPIDLAEYRYLSARREHAERHEPDLPEANPHAPIDHMRTPPAF